MPKTHEMKESKFLKQADVGRGTLGTIQKVLRMNVAAEGADPELKWCMEFAEIEKPLVLNATNIALCEKICASDDTDAWIGKRIVLYVDPSISYGGKIVGGIRVRAPKPTAPKAPPPPPPLPPEETMATGEFDDSDIPF